jgi:hypothetical protein
LAKNGVCLEESAAVGGVADAAGRTGLDAVAAAGSGSGGGGGFVVGGVDGAEGAAAALGAVVVAAAGGDVADGGGSGGWRGAAERATREALPAWVAEDQTCALNSAGKTQPSPLALFQTHSNSCKCN